MSSAPTSCRKTHYSRRGAAAVEFALILPVLVTVVLGCVDFGRFAYNYIAVTNAARAGASYGIMNNWTKSTYGTWQSGVTKAAQDEITAWNGPSQLDAAIPGQNADQTKLTVTPTTTVDKNTGLVTVQVTATYPFQTIVNWNWTGLTIPNSVNLTRTVEMRSIR